MRGGSFLVVLLGFLLGPASVQAGLYNPAEPNEGVISPDDFPKFQRSLIYLRSIPAPKVDVENALRLRYILQVESAPRLIPGHWTTAEKLSLSAYLIRRRQPLKAIEVLRPLTRDRKNFLALANMATAYQTSQELSSARDYLQQALEAWPTDLPQDGAMKPVLDIMRWTAADLRFFRDVETYHHKLLKLRSREDPKKMPETLDALFDDGRNPPQPLRFIGETGNYEVGKLASAEMKKLPRNYLDIVQQLLVWMPEDARLTWLLAELYNARGKKGDSERDIPADVKVAEMILEELAGFKSSFRFRPEELREHQRILKSRPPEIEEKTKRDSQEEKTGIDWQSLGVGFGAGLIVMLFAQWQLREIRRRRQSRASA